MKSRTNEQDLPTLEAFEKVYGIQKQSISRRLLGAKEPATTRAVSYLTENEMEAVKNLANNIGLNVSTLIRLTMTELASAYMSPAGTDHRALLS